MVNKKIVFVGCHEYGYEIINYLISNGIEISHIVSLNEEQAKLSYVSGYCSFDTISKKYTSPIYYPETFSLKNERDFEFFSKNQFDYITFLIEF